MMTNSNYCDHISPNCSNNYDTPSLHSYQIRNQQSLRIPSNKLTFKHSLMYLRPKIRNDVPIHIKHSMNQSISDCRKRIGSLLLCMYVKYITAFISLLRVGVFKG